MLKFGTVFDNILTLLVIGGLGYIIYMKYREKHGGEGWDYRNLFSKAREITEKVNLKDRGDNFGK